MKHFCFSLWTWSEQPSLYIAQENYGLQIATLKAYKKNSECVEKQNKKKKKQLRRETELETCPENASLICSESATILKEMLFGCTDQFCLFLLLNSLWRQVASRLLFPLLALNVTFKDLLMWLFFSSSPFSIYTSAIFAHCCLHLFSLLNAHSIFPQSWGEMNKVCGGFESDTGIWQRCVWNSKSAGFHSDIILSFFFLLQHTVKGLIKEKGLCVVPRDLKWLHGERGGGRKGI